MKSRARVCHDTAGIWELHTENDGTWLVQVAQATSGFWYAVDQEQPVGALRYVGPLGSREDALEIAYDRFARPIQHATISSMATPKSVQAARARHQMPEVLVKLGVPQEEFEDMLEAIDREGYFEIGPDDAQGIQTIDRAYSFSELGLEEPDHDEGG